MPIDAHELEWALGVTRAEIDARIDRLEVEPERVYNTVSSEIAELKYKFEVLFNNVNAVLLKLQECARHEDLVDDMGGSLDEFIELFVVH